MTPAIENLRATYDEARKDLGALLPPLVDGQRDYSGVDDARMKGIEEKTAALTAAKAEYEAAVAKANALDGAASLTDTPPIEWAGTARKAAVDSAGNVQGDDAAAPLMAEEANYKAAFDRYLRSNGKTTDHDDLALFGEAQRKSGKNAPEGIVVPPSYVLKAIYGQTKAVREGVDTEGGYAVHPDMSNQLAGRVAAPTRLLDLVFRTGASSDVLKVPGLSSTGDVYSSDVRIAWTGEEGPATEDTGLENFTLKEINIHDGQFEVATTKSMREDAVFDVGAWIVDKVRDAYQTGIQDVIVNGTGVGRPLGFMQAASGVTTFNVGNPATAAGLVQFVGDLPEQYANNAYVVANRSWAWQTVGVMVDTAGAFIGLLSSRQAGLAAAREDALAGFPLVYAAQMAVAGANNRVAMMADLRRLYWLVERTVMTIEPIGNGSDAYRRAGADGWYVRFRVGGLTINPWAGRIAVQA